MMTSTARSRPIVLLAGVIAVGLALGGCSSETPDTTGVTASTAESDAFPVTIEHKHGETTITEEPERIVLVGLNEQDALLALGVVPVAVTFWGANDAEGGIGPWATGYLGDAPLPEVLDNSDGVPLEQIAALEPDLILGQYAGLTEEEYDDLSTIAPTVAQPGEYADWGVPWDVATMNIGEAIGKSVEAEELVASVNETIDGYAAEYEDVFTGQTGTAVTLYEGLWFYGPQDPRGRMLDQLGIGFPEQLENEDPELFGWSISTEQVGELDDVGVVVWLTTSEMVDDELGRVWEETTAAQEGRVIYLSDNESRSYISAFTFITPLSIPYMLERYVPQLAAALDGDPTTEVPVITD